MKLIKVLILLFYSLNSAFAYQDSCYLGDGDKKYASNCNSGDATHELVCCKKEISGAYDQCKWFIGTNSCVNGAGLNAAKCNSKSEVSGKNTSLKDFCDDDDYKTRY